MRLLLITSSSKLGGVEKLVLSLGKALRDRHTVDVAVIDSAGELHDAYFETFRTRWDVCTYRSTHGLGIEAALTLLPLARYDRIHLFNHFALSELLIAGGYGPKLIQSIHFHPEAMPEVYRDMLAVHRDELAGIIVDSHLHHDYLPDARLIPNFVDADYFTPSPIPVQRSGVLWVGKFTAAKNPDLLCEIVRKASARFTVVNGVPTVPGTCDYRSRLEAAGARVIEKASALAMRKLYREHRCLLITSRHEGTPIALLEAMACGCIPVSTRAGHIPAVVEHGNTGWLYDTADEAAEALLRDSCLIPDRCREYILAHHSAAVVVPQYEEVYGIAP